MDLSNLSSNLPLSHPLDDESIDQINRDLSNEFKLGARSIAALYRLSNAKNSLFKANGYLSCLNDILDVIDHDSSVTTLDELRSVLVAKKTELTGKQEQDRKQDQQPTPTVEQPQEIPQDYKFQFASDTPSPRFPPSKLPLSIQHTNTKHIHSHSSPQQLSDRVNKLKETFKKATGELNDDDSDDTEHNESDESMSVDDGLKRRLADTRSTKKLKSDHD
ncbi:hypothetical protein OGAPHI_005559 [Ogataea philodendri]|uniref:Uncharacterized protein n=1 Tax=Ogataea philodendri TaxID=1378263 RepID=A0A9P8NYM1_9ASCO|nr:uncharacterized protein OGAPHI_005559 [Ogataea philodendri]KAH3662308.1 hypothetical protein OGAPHI_005559 [Ogataea philodendri]